MVIPDITNPFYAQIVRGVEETGIKNGYELMVCNSSLKPDLERRRLDALQAQRVDGILLLPSSSYAARDVLARNYPPIVFVDCFPIGSKVNCVVTDNIEASYKVVRYLIGLGHRKIAVISAELTYSTTIDRMEGYRKAMQEAGIPIRLEYTVQSTSNIEGGHRSGLRLLKLNEPPTAIFSLNNRITLGILQAFRELRIPCPERVSIISYDDPDWAVALTPGLTTIKQPMYQIGAASAQLLLKVIRSAGSKVAKEVQQVQLTSKLIIRESTGPAPEISEV